MTPGAKVMSFGRHFQTNQSPTTMAWSWIDTSHTTTMLKQSVPSCQHDEPFEDAQPDGNG